jgi:coenzyme Q-binding protein COQ10
MPTYFAHADLPYAPQQVFDLVADIESYPKFLHHVAAARIRRRNGSTLWVDQVVRFGMLRLRFSTRAVLEPASRIRVVCHDSRFGTFDETWSFVAEPSGGTRLDCHATYALRSALIQRALGPALSDLLSTSVQAFQARAAQLYGRAASASGERMRAGLT